MAITLDTNDPTHTQVASASNIEFDTGVSGQKAVIFSGIAIPDWNLNDDDNIYHQTVTVLLRYVVSKVLNATISIGLASIYNGDSNFLFATDSASLAIDSATQELQLVVDLALMGDPASLNRFGYQVVVVAAVQVTGIAGTIRFAKSVFDATGFSPAQVQQLFMVSANTQTWVPNPAGGFGTLQSTPVAFGTITGITTNGTDFDVAYDVPGAPYDQQLYVTVQNGPSFTPSQPTAIGQTAGPSPVTITAAAPSVSGVDFRVGAVSIIVPK